MDDDTKMKRDMIVQVLNRTPGSEDDKTAKANNILQAAVDTSFDEDDVISMLTPSKGTAGFAIHDEHTRSVSARAIARIIKF